MPSKLLLAAALFTVAGNAQTFTGLSLKIGDSIQPPGGVAQMQVFLTEPKPISTGKGKMAFATQTTVPSVNGVSLFSAAGDAAGAAVVQSNQLRLICMVPSTALGSNPDFPILAITGGVSSSAPLGSSTALTINPANLIFLDPMGEPYPEEIKPGTLTIAQNVSITDINPGATLVPAGGTVVIHGLNFTPQTTVRIKENVNITSVQYVSATELDVTLQSATQMYGKEVTVTNPDGTSAVYYSFQRTTPVGLSGSSLLRATIPVFSTSEWTFAAFALPADTASTYSGIAVQNLQTSAATVKILLVAQDGSPLGQRSFSLASNTRVTRRVTEYISTPAPAGSFWVVQSNLPVQVLGLNADTGTGFVTAILPGSAH